MRRKKNKGEGEIYRVGEWEGDRETKKMGEREGERVEEERVWGKGRKCYGRYKVDR